MSSQHIPFTDDSCRCQYVHDACQNIRSSLSLTSHNSTIISLSIMKFSQVLSIFAYLAILTCATPIRTEANSNSTQPATKTDNGNYQIASHFYSRSQYHSNPIAGYIFIGIFGGIFILFCSFCLIKDCRIKRKRRRAQNAVKLTGPQQQSMHPDGQYYHPTIGR